MFLVGVVVVCECFFLKFGWVVFVLFVECVVECVWFCEIGCGCDVGDCVGGVG